jgi:hypothetical protein
LFVVFRRQDQHGSFVSRLTIPRQEDRARELRQHQIQDNQVILIILRHKEARLAIIGHVHSISGALPQTICNILRETFFILDDQCSHSSSAAPLDPNCLAKVTLTAEDFAHSSKYIATLFYSGLMAPARLRL